MNRSFEILEPSIDTCHTSLEYTGTKFQASSTKCVQFASSLMVILSSAQDDNSNDDQFMTIFDGVESLQEELITALKEDYEAQSKLVKQLDRLKESLKSNWNGEDDCPIEDRAYFNTKVSILSTPGVMLKYWRLFPNPNGTLLLSPKDKTIAGISIGNDDFSYAAFVSDDKQMSGKEPFSVQAFKSALKQIHRILGYV